MNLRIIALTALTTLIPLSKSTAVCGVSCAGDEDNLSFHGKVTLPLSQNAYTATMTMYTVPLDGTDAYLTGDKREVSSSDTTTENSVMALTTGTGSMHIEPELPYQGKVNITGNVENTAVCLTLLSGTFEINVPCGMVLETRYRIPEATDYSDWKAIETIKQYVVPAYGVYLDVTVDIQVRLHKKANDSGSGDGNASNGDGGGGSGGGNDTTATPPTIPQDKQKEHPENGQPAEVTPAGFKSSLPLGSTPESGGFNTGSLSLQGPINPLLANMANLIVRDPDGNSLKVYKSGLGDQLQIRNSTRLADVLPITGGFEVSIYEAGSFAPPSTEPGLSTPLTTATPSQTIRYEGINGVEGIHLGGVRVTSTGPNGVERVKEVVKLSGGGARVTTGGGMQVEDTISAFYDDNQKTRWYRADVTTVTRDGVLYSKTERIYLYQYREVGTSPAVMVENRLFQLEERVYYSNSNNTRLVTTWEPDPVFPGHAKSVVRPDGSWEAYSYYSGEETGAYPCWVGLTKEILRPFNGSPSLENATSSNSELTLLTYDDIGDRVQSRITYKPGTSVVIRDWARIDSSASLGTLVGLLEDAGLTTAWGNCCSYTYIRQDSSAEYASASEGIPSTSFIYVGSPAPGCPWVGASFGSLDAEGNGYVTGYELGHFTGGSFTANDPSAIPQPWSDVRSITIRIANYGAPASSEATREIIIRDFRGRPYLRTLSIKSGASWSDATTTSYTYEYWADGSVKEVTASQDGRMVSHEQAVFIGGVLNMVAWDGQGTETDTVSDDLGRISSSTRAGVAVGTYNDAQPDIVTNHEYRGRATTSRVSAGGIWRTEVSIADLAGRTISHRDASGAVTNTSYSNNGLVVLTTLPGGLTRQVARDINGRTVSITGSAVVAEQYAYSWDSSGNLVTTKSVGNLQNSPRYTTSVQDWAGRTLSTTSPSPTGTDTVSTVATYQSGTHRMISSAAPSGTLLYVKPSLASSTTYTGYHVDSNGTLPLSPASNDRVTETGNYYDYVEDDDQSHHWWEVSVRKTYDVASSDESVVTSITKRCLSGLPGGGVATKTISISPTGEVTTVTTSVDLESKTVTRTEMSNGASRNAVSVTVNGLTVAQTGHDHATPARWYYNALGQPVMEVSPRGAVTRKSYDPVSGALLSVTDPSANTTRYSYYAANSAAAGKLSQIANPLGGTTTYQYSALGQVTEESGTATYRVAYGYDAYGARNTMKTWRDAGNANAWSLTTRTYQSGTGLLVSKTDGDSHTVSYTYDSAGRILTRTWARTGTVTTTYSYDNFGDLTGVTYSDGTPNVEFSNLDRLGRPTTITQTGVGIETLSYHAGMGTLNARYYTSGSLLPGKGIRYAAPDSAGRPAGYQETASSNASVVATIAYGYYGDSGLLDTIQNTTTNEFHEYTYEPNSSLVSKSDSSAGGVYTFRDSRYHDTSGRLLGIRSDQTFMGDAVAEISYHAYAYDALNRRVKNTFQDGSNWWEYDYNDRSEVVSAKRYIKDDTTTPPTTTEIEPLGTGYTFDDIGNRLASTSPVLGNHTYTADAANRYSSITTGGSRTAIGRAPADWNINIKAGTETGNGVVVTPSAGGIYSRDLTASNGDGPVWQQVVTKRDTESGVPSFTNHFWYAKQSVTPQYDDDGNLTNDGRWVYTWDAENRLVQMETTSEATSTNVGHPYVKIVYAYDWMGRMIARHAWKGGTAGYPAFQSSQRWLYDGWNVIAEFSADYDTQNETFTTPTRTGTFTWGLDLSGTLRGAGGVGGLLAYRNLTSSAVFHPSFDGNGNIVAWTRSDATEPVSRREYDAFGNALVSEGTAPCSFGFSTKMQDAETGLYYYGYRWYDPLTGRWPSRDLIGERGGVNLYEFVGDDGVDRWDFLGFAPESTPAPLLPMPEFLNSIFELPGWVNCFGYATRRRVATEPKAGKSFADLTKQLGYDCHKNVSAEKCKDTCKCKDWIMLYFYIPHLKSDRTTENDPNKVKEDLQNSKDGVPDFFENSWSGSDHNIVDYHALRGEADGTYTYQEHGAQIGAPDDHPEPYPNKKNGFPDYFSDIRTFSKYCCCKIREEAK